MYVSIVVISKILDPIKKSAKYADPEPQHLAMFHISNIR
jgi:hypothetical protein